MAPILAFVGHSFDEDDAEVVRKFLDYFTQISKSGLHFSWEHAEAAEPKILAEKVMSIISGKNVFIGLCTKKEYVVAPKAITASRLPRGHLKGKEVDFHWKTSDWVIQEIGLAKGKDLPIILLQERGVRIPGGIQGDVEYITFDRGTPEKSFGKILEMLSALSPKDSSQSVASADGRAAATKEEPASTHQGDDHWSNPRPEWKRDQYELAAHFKVLLDDTEGFERINQAYLATEEAEQGDNRISWIAYIEYTRLLFGKNGSLTKLETLAEKDPHSSGTLDQLALGYRVYKEYGKSARAFERAARESTSGNETVRLLGQAAEDYQRAGEYQKVASLTVEIKAVVNKNPEAEIRMLRALRELSELRKDNEVTLGILERIIELEPNDTDARFSLAYKYSQRGSNDLGLFHYLRIPYRERNGITWNNLGVAYERFKLPVKSVDAYRQAKAMGETLAMSNLAIQLLSAGLLTEAQEECDDALKVKHYHENVGHTVAKLKETPGRESKEEAEVVKKAKLKSDFYRQFGRAVSEQDIVALSGQWRGPKCELSISVDGTNFRANGSYEVAGNALALGGLFGANKSDQMRVEYSGTMRGRAVECHVTREREGVGPATKTLLGSLLITVLMVLTDDGNELRVMENPEAIDPEFYVLGR